MTDYAIQVRDIGKRYYIGAEQTESDVAVKVLFRSLIAPFRRAGALLRGHATGAAELNQAIWALRDISFDVKRGEVIGIIGHNGAGKSTLLKILTRITTPTEGQALLDGRVGSLLEVGTGFHQELTGRENVYLNGAILGMTRAEINARFNEIVGFSGVKQFIDTPVKHYSSGMRVRLAFAVAAYLEPEILLIDEVLSVGDAEFQKKSIGRMNDISQTGRTVLFVSHNMPAVRALCDRVLLLKNGRIIHDGDVDAGIQMYLRSGGTGDQRASWQETDASVLDNEIAAVHSVRIKHRDGDTRDAFMSDEAIHVEMQVLWKQWNPSLRFGFELGKTTAGELFRTWHDDETPLLPEADFQPGLYRMQATIPANLLNHGTYTITPLIAEHRRRFISRRDNVVQFDVALHLPNTDRINTGRSGIISPLLDWEVTYQASPQRVSSGLR
jgi:lipopolysaccharide transport system ATP-binding protein